MLSPMTARTRGVIQTAKTPRTVSALLECRSARIRGPGLPVESMAFLIFLSVIEQLSSQEYTNTVIIITEWKRKTCWLIHAWGLRVHREVSNIRYMLYSSLVVGWIKWIYHGTSLQNFTWLCLRSLSSRIWSSVLYFMVMQFGYPWDRHSHFITKLKLVNYQDSQLHYRRKPTVWMG